MCPGSVGVGVGVYEVIVELPALASVGEDVWGSREVSLSLSPCHTHSLSHSLSLTHTLSLSHTHTHTR